MSMSSRLYERARSMGHLIRQRWATLRARVASRVRRSGLEAADAFAPVEALESRVYMSATIAGRIFADADQDGAYDEGETGISSWQVYLDQNQNGVFDSGETEVSTDTSGDFLFDGLSAGTYYVRATADTGWTVVSPSGGTQSVTLATNEAAEDKDFAFHYKRIIDDGDSDYQRSSSGWTDDTYSTAYSNDYDYSYIGSGSNTATWTFDGLVTGYYEVFAAYPTSSWLALDTPYTVFDGTTSEGVARVNQTVTPSDLQADGGWWKRLGVFLIEDGSLAVQVSDAATGPHLRGRRCGAGCLNDAAYWIPADSRRR